MIQKAEAGLAQIESMLNSVATNKHFWEATRKFGLEGIGPEQMTSMLLKIYNFINAYEKYSNIPKQQVPRVKTQDLGSQGSLAAYADTLDMKSVQEQVLKELWEFLENKKS